MKKKAKGKITVIGLTGGIGMGKSTVANILAAKGLPVHSADHAVHRLLGRNGKAVAKVARAFPDTLVRDEIDRARLAQHVFTEPGALKRLEAILHPMVRAAELAFLGQARRRGVPAAVLEIPLLFETGAEKRCDVVLCVSAPSRVQKLRVARRPGMTAAKFKAMLARQMNDRERRKRADFIIPTGGTLTETKDHLDKALSKILGEKKT